MKRIFSILFIVALIIAAVTLVACQKEEAPVHHQHSFTTEVTNPVCSTETVGFTTHTCGCGYSYITDYVEPHKFVSTVLVPTCEYTGYTEHVCSLCGYTKHDAFTAKNPDNHVFFYPNDYVDEEGSSEKAGKANITKVVPSTCTDYGYSVYTCIYCSATTVEEIVPEVTAHTWGAWETVIVANCVNGGLEKRFCEGCGFEDQRLTSKTDDHVYGEWTVVISDDHINDFYEERSCTMCKYKEVGLNNEEGVLALELVVEEDGSKHYVVVGYAEGKTSSTVVIPEYLYENNEKIYVTEIKAQAFMYNTNLQNIYIPTSIAKIGAFAFSGCTTLVQINYLGTQAQWDAMEKSTSWNYKSGDFKVVTK